MLIKATTSHVHTQAHALGLNNSPGHVWACSKGQGSCPVTAAVDERLEAGGS
jgi:hypothetical protein